MSTHPLPTYATQDNFEVEFDQNAGNKSTCCLYSCISCSTVIGILCLPCMPWFAKNYISAQECSVDDLRINYKSGWINKEDKMIPLDRIQDVNISRDIISRMFGTATVKIETAGSSSPEAGPEATLVAPKNPNAIRDEIIRRRDNLVHSHGAPASASDGGLGGKFTKQQPGGTSMMSTEVLGELKEIRQCLNRIEESKTGGGL